MLFSKAGTDANDTDLLKTQSVSFERVCFALYDIPQIISLKELIPQGNSRIARDNKTKSGSLPKNIYSVLNGCLIFLTGALILFEILKAAEIRNGGIRRFIIKYIHDQDGYKI